MPELKITYFDFPGRAEAARLALTIGEIPFEDTRLHPHEFAALKQTLPYGSLPILTVNGTAYAQSAAILRYCATLAGLYPTDPHPAQRADEVVDVIVEFVDGLERVAAETDTDEDDDDGSMHQMRLLKYVNGAVPRLLGGLEHRLREFGDGPWAVGDAITIGDLAIYVCLLNIAAGAFDRMTLRPLRAYTRIMAVFEAVRAHPKVAAWNDDLARRAEQVRNAALEEIQGEDPEPLEHD